MRPALVIARNELRRVFLDRTTLFLILVLPVMIMMIVGSTFFGDEGELPIGVIDRDRSELSSRVQRALDRSPAVAVFTYTDTDELARDVRTGRVHAGMVIPADLDADGRIQLVTDPVRQSTGAIRRVIGGVLADQSAPLGAAAMATDLTGTDFDDNVRRAYALTELGSIDIATEAIGRPVTGPANQFWLLCCIRGRVSRRGAAGQGWAESAEVEHGEGDERVG